MGVTETDNTPETNRSEEAGRVADPRQMTRAQLRGLGVPRLVYLRCGTVDGGAAYAIHAADGTALAVVDDIEVAMELALENNMTFVPVH